MYVKLKYKLKSMANQIASLPKEITVKEAESYFNVYLKNDPDVTEVWLDNFDGWHWRTKKILKKEINK